MSGSSSSESEDVGSDVHLSDEEFPVSGDESLPGDDNFLEEDDGQKESNWANALKKVLKTSKNPEDGQSKVLSKAKKMSEIERIKVERKGYGFEIEGEVKPDTKAEDNETTKEIVKRMKQRREIRENLLSLRVKPTILDREREKTFQKIGTKGIVQLFNAVRAQQKDLDIKLQEAGKPEYKREKVLKSVKKKTFLDALMNGPRAKSEFVDNAIKDEAVPRKRVKKEEADSDDSDTHKSIWSALKEDFMTNNKNWDKSDEEEGASNSD